MPIRRLRVAGATDGTLHDVRAALAALRDEVGAPRDFPAPVLAEAQAAGPDVTGPDLDDRTDLRDVPFVTIDPPGAQDLDQALHLERSGDGFRVRYAIADVAAFVEPGGAIDAEAHERGVTLYGVGEKIPLHPPVLSEGSASLLPGVDRPAAVWTIDLDAAGRVVAAHVERALVRSRRQLTYDDVQSRLDAQGGAPPTPGDAPDGSSRHGDAARSTRDAQSDGQDDVARLARLLRAVGTRRQKRERARGGVSLDVPEQVVVTHDDGTTTLEFRGTVPVESWNAQISLLTGIAAARLMVDAGVGILRTLPAAGPADVRRLRLRALSLGVDWPQGRSYADVIASLDPRDPRTAGFRTEATALFRGASYQVLGAPAATEGPPQEHAALASVYAHVTAPLRRLVDRYGTEVCLAVCAGRPVPDWVVAGLADLPATMARGTGRASRYQHGCLDVLEAALLTGHVSETYPALAVEEDVVLLREPAVRATVAGAHLGVGDAVTVRVDSVSVADREVRLSVVAG